MREHEVGKIAERRLQGRFFGHDVALAGHDSLFRSVDSTVTSHAGRLTGHDNLFGEANTSLVSHASRLGNHDNLFQSVNTTLVSHASRHDGHDTNFASHSSRITTAQNSANSADANASSRIRDGIGTVVRAHYAADSVGLAALDTVALIAYLNDRYSRLTHAH